MDKNKKNIIIIALLFLLVGLMVSLTIIISSQNKTDINVAGTGHCDRYLNPGNCGAANNCSATSKGACEAFGDCCRWIEQANDQAIPCASGNCSANGCLSGEDNVGSCRYPNGTPGTCCKPRPIVQACAGQSCQDGGLITTPGATQCKCLCSNGRIIGQNESCTVTQNPPPPPGNVGECGGCTPGGAITCSSGTCCSCGKCGGVGKTCNQICNQNACGGGTSTTTTTTTTGGGTTSPQPQPNPNPTNPNPTNPPPNQTGGTTAAAVHPAAQTTGTTTTTTTSGGSTSNEQLVLTDLPNTGVEDNSMLLILGIIAVLMGFSLFRARKLN